MSFVLDPRIAAASHRIGQDGPCDVRLQDDARFPWIVLVPMRAGLMELEDLAAGQGAEAMAATLRAGGVVRAVGEALGRPVQKLNIGQLGNVVAQLHLHVVGRREDDPCWPGPVWGCGAAEPYAPDALARALAAARAAMGFG